MISLELPAFNARQQADGADGVLVHSIVVIHVILHLRHHPAKIRDEPAKNPGFIHAPQVDLAFLLAGQHPQEIFIGAFVIADLVGDAVQVQFDQPQRVGVDVKTLVVRDRKNTDDQPWVFLQVVWRNKCQPPCFNGKFLKFFGPAEARKEGCFLLPRFKYRTEDACQVAHLFGDQEIVFHETLDATGAGMVLVAQLVGQHALIIKGNAFLGAARKEVQRHPHRPQEGLGFLELAVF